MIGTKEISLIARQIVNNDLDDQLIYDSIQIIDPKTEDYLAKASQIVSKQLSHDRLNRDQKASDEVYKNYICENATNLHSLKLFTSDFKAFNEATEDLELRNLKTIEIVRDCDTAEMVTPEFLSRCTSIKNLRVEQSNLPFYLVSILKLPALRTLQIHCNKQDKLDEILLTEIIIKNSGLIKRIQAKIVEFPPIWLRRPLATVDFDHLEELALCGSKTMRFCNARYLLKNMPMYPVLKNLWIIGNKISNTLILIFACCCPNLQVLALNQRDRVEQLKSAIRETQIEGYNLQVDVVYREFVMGKSLCIDFI